MVAALIFESRSKCDREEVVDVLFFERHGNTCFGQFHEGAIYTIEFEDGVAADVHESQLEPMVPIGNSAWSLLC